METSNDTTKKKSTNKLSIKFVCIILGASIGLNLIGFLLSIYFKQHEIQDYFSYTLGFLSLVFAIWGLCIAGNIKKALTSRSILSPIENLRIKYSAASGNGSIKYVRAEDIDEAKQTLNFAIKAGKLLSQDVINAINNAILYLEGKQNGKSSDTKPLYSVLINYLDAIINASH